MSDVLYPLGAIENLRVEMIDRTLLDEFEDGSQAARQLWTARYFKRRFRVQHTAMSVQEFEYLRSFFAARSGRYDSFWFHDSVHRTGNAKVRLAQAFTLERTGMVYRPEVVLEEVAPIRALPDAAEITETIGAPLAIYDPQRQSWWKHAGTSYFDQQLWDSSGNNAHLQWASASTFPYGDTTAQYSNFNTSKAYGATGLANQAGSIFLVAKKSATAGTKILAASGAVGTRTAIGVQGDATHIFPYRGDTSETYTNAKSTYDSNWHTWAVDYTAGNKIALYKDGALVGEDAGSASLIAATNFGLMCAPDGTDGFTGDLGPVLIFNGAFADINSVIYLHNLYGPQYGLATV